MDSKDFVKFLTSDKVLKLAAGYLVANATREFFDAFNDGLIWPTTLALSTGKKPSINYLRIIRETVQFIFNLVMMYALIVGVQKLTKKKLY
jgi:large-conductance mechanosensitive channel